jgi:hypothetical protein
MVDGKFEKRAPLRASDRLAAVARGSNPALNPERMHLFRYIIENGDLSRKQTGGQAHAKAIGMVTGRRAFWCSRGCECANSVSRGGRRVIRRQLSLGFFRERKHNLHDA